MVSGDHHFPRYHPRPPRGFVNDPNGPVRSGGRWQLYFQYNPDTAQGEPVVWGHLSSPDLVDWRLHEPAIRPHDGGPDRDGCWSGNTVVSAEKVLAFYSGYRDQHPYQSVLRAESPDGGYSFGDPRQAVADPEEAEQVAFFRDPFVWRDGRSWSMVVGSGSRAGRPAVRLYHSADLSSWEFAGHLLTGEDLSAAVHPLGAMWECPQVVSVAGRLLVVFGTWAPDTGIGRALAVVGTHAGDRLVDPAVMLVDHGPNFYAVSLLADEVTGGPVLWGWLTEGRSRERAIAAGWAGVLSLPRVADLTDGNGLVIRPHPNLELLRRHRYRRADAGPGLLRYEGIDGQFELVLRLRPGGSSRSQVRLALVCGVGERVLVVADWQTGMVAVDCGALAEQAAGEVGFLLAGAGNRAPVELRLFVDGSVGELFTSSGASYSFRFYPGGAPPWQLEASGLDPADTVEVWRLVAHDDQWGSRH